MSDKRDLADERALALVKEHIDWHHHGRPKPTGGFPPEYFADWLIDNIATALREAAERGDKRIEARLRDPDEAMVEAMADAFADALETSVAAIGIER